MHLPFSRFSPILRASVLRGFRIKLILFSANGKYPVKHPHEQHQTNKNSKANCACSMRAA